MCGADADETHAFKVQDRQVVSGKEFNTSEWKQEGNDRYLSQTPIR